MRLIARMLDKTGRKIEFLLLAADVAYLAFGPLAAFNLITIFLGLWPLGGLGILLWLISWFVCDFIESSRFGRRGLTTLSLR